MQLEVRLEHMIRYWIALEELHQKRTALIEMSSKADGASVPLAGKLDPENRIRG